MVWIVRSVITRDAIMRVFDSEEKALEWICEQGYVYEVQAYKVH